MPKKPDSPPPAKKLKTMEKSNELTSADRDIISRLSGYFEALRSKKDVFSADEGLAIKTAAMIVENEEPEKTENPMLLTALPFPFETCNLDDLIHLHALQNTQPVESFDSMGPNDNADLILWIMKDFIFKLWGLHYSGMTHGNLKPQNVLYVEGECVLKSTINDVSNSLEWKAPEQILHDTPSTKASDMFTFGCILYFCISKGCHPFGNTPDQCIQNIKANKADISLVKDYPDVHHLISLLLNSEPESRPKAVDAYSHPFFRNARSKLQLVYCICIHIGDDEELEDRLKCKIPMFGDKNWRERLIEFTRTYRYSFEPPFEDYKDVFGPRGSPTFFPTIFMEAVNVVVKAGAFKHNPLFSKEDKLDDSYYPLVEKNGFMCPFFFDDFGAWW